MNQLELEYARKRKEQDEGGYGSRHRQVRGLLRKRRAGRCQDSVMMRKSLSPKGELDLMTSEQVNSIFFDSSLPQR